MKFTVSLTILVSSILLLGNVAAAQTEPANSSSSSTVVQTSPFESEVQQLKDGFLRIEAQNKTYAKLDWTVESATLAQQMLIQNSVTLTESQTIIVVDRNPKVQHAWAVAIDPTTNRWVSVADAPVSTGTTGRVHYYYTPTGVFAHTPDILGYRAEGTKNENGVRGLGKKGMRVWDFGWQKSYTAWLKTNEIRDIRFQMHATDPDLLEKRLGTTASKGCVRVSSAFNAFVDQYALLDKDYLISSDARALSTLNKQRTPTQIPGKYLVVVDSSI